MIKKCLYCGEEFEAKKDTAKYCSESHKVMFNRNKPKKEKPQNVISELQAQVLYNAVLDMVGKINYGTVPTIDLGISLKNNGVINPVSDTTKKEYKIKRSFEWFVQAKFECETTEQWLELKAEIEASDLSQKQKSLLL